MAEAALSDEELGALEAEMAQVCGVLNAATGRLVALIAKALATGARQQAGICSPGHWVAWRCGLAPARARSLSRYVFAGGDNGQAAEDTGSAPPEEVRTVSFSHDDDGSWRLSARLPADQGAAVEAALVEARDALFRSGEGDDGGDGPADSPSRISWADALVAMAQSSLDSAAAARPYSSRHQVLVHLDIGGRGGAAAWTHGGSGLPDCLRRLMTCDASVRPVWQAKGTAVSVGRAQRAVPARTRVAVEGVTGAVWCRAVTAPAGCRCTTSCTGRTAAPPTRPKGPAQNYLRRSGPMTPTLVDEMRK